MSLPDRIGKFEIIKRLGKGAMGEVFLGRDPVLGREVAIKTILTSSAFGEETGARFEREAKATALLNHPNIVTVYEFGNDEGLHYLAMEYLEGDDLEVLIRKRSWPKPFLLEVLAQVCDGLGYAHEQGVIHRDVKPANILVIHRGKRIQAKLMDFGVALLSHSDLTQEGVWMGTANYMAPEYLDTGKATPSSDLFAVGVMLYEVLSGGRKPFAGETMTVVLNAILRQPPQPLEPAEIQDVAPGLLRVAQKALLKMPENRYPTAEALGMAIREAMREAAAPAPPPSPAASLASKTELIREVPSSRLKTLVVGKGGRANCLSLRVALRQAEPGSQILVQPGVYRESLLVDKDVEILGDGPAAEIILESVKGPCLQIRTPDCTIQGLNFRKVPTEPDESPVIQIQSGKTTLRNCTILSPGGPALILEGSGTQGTAEGCRFGGGGRLGVEIRSGTTFAAVECQWEGHRRLGLLVGSTASATLNQAVFQGGEGTAIVVKPHGQARLEDCVIEDYLAGGVEVESEARATLSRCRVQGSHYAGLLAQEKAQAILEDCEISGQDSSAVHVVQGASVQLRRCRLSHNQGFGFSVMNRGLGTLEDCEISHNHHPGVLIHSGGTAQLKKCRLYDGESLGVVCAPRGRGVLEGCEIYGNAQSGAKVEPGGSLLLVQCIVRDGQDTGLLLFEDAEVTLEQCVVHRNARGGILLTKDASDPILRKGNRIEDDLWRANANGELIKVVPLKQR